MATEKQCQYFQYLYEQENARELQLNGYAKGLTSLLTLYSGFVLFVAEKMRGDLHNLVIRYVFFFVLITLLSGLLMAIIAARLSRYMVSNSPDQVIEQYGSKPMSDEEFFDNMIAGFVTATNSNVRTNNNKALMLELSAFTLAFGIILHGTFFVLALAAVPHK